MRHASSVPLTCGLLLVLASCARVVPGEPAPPPVPAAVDAPPIEEGVSSPAEDRAVAELLVEAERRLEQGDAAGARQITEEVETRFPQARGASRALWLRARAETDLGVWAEAERALGRYLSLVGPADPLVPSALLLRAEIRLEGGLPGGIEALFQVPIDVPQAVREGALASGRTVARGLEDPALRDLLEEAPRHPWLFPVFQVEMASRRALVGDFGAARSLAEAALALEPSAEERERAERVLAGEAVTPEGVLTGSLGLILPSEASPGLERLAGMIREGVEVALLGEGMRGGVRLLPLDADDSPRAVEQALRRLEGEEVLAVVGPLTDPGLAEAVRTRAGNVPILLSPTARLVPEGVPGVYSLTGPDPESSRTLARAALSRGVRDVVLLHATDPQEEMEARWFREAYEAGGGRVARIVSYPPGTTDYERALQQVASLEPAGLVLFLPPDDVALLAPQIAHYGVDDLELQIFGGASWASEAVLEEVPPRHTDGVISVAPHVGEGYGPAWAAFVRMYEDHFQRTLRSPVPALGYDAALLIVEAARREGARPEEVARGLASIRGLPAATGTLSVQEGRIVRAYVPVRLEDRRRVPLAP